MVASQQMMIAVAATWAGLPAQTVQFEVASLWAPEALSIEIEAEWLGETKVARLRNDGTLPGDLAGDAIWMGSLSGEAVRALPVRVWVSAADLSRREVAASVETISMPADRIAWALVNDPQPRARRAALALPTRQVEMVESSSVAALTGWAGFCLAWVGWLVHRARR